MRAMLTALVLVLAGMVPAVAEPLGEPPDGLGRATFAGGCFWCVEEAFDKLEGVEQTISGYTGGEVRDPSYRQVSNGTTGHTEAVRVHYDPDVVSYRELLDHFWRNIDPTVEDRQFCDKGSQYRTGIFYHDAEQRRLAEQTRRAIEESGQLPGPVVTEITEAGPFYPAEDYHQNYYKKNPTRYRFYVTACGRYDRLEELWGDEARGKAG